MVRRHDAATRDASACPHLYSAWRQLDQHALPCRAVQGLGSVRSLLKQHFPLVGGVWTLSLKATAQKQYQLCTFLQQSVSAMCRTAAAAAAVPKGLDEVVIATIMLPVLEAIEYVHKNNGIHRDVKVRVCLCVCVSETSQRVWYSAQQLCCWQQQAGVGGRTHAM